MKTLRSRSATEGDAFVKEWRKNGLRSTFGRLRRNGLKGQEAFSPGHRPGDKEVGKFALKGQKPRLTHYLMAYALTGRWLRITFTQGDALGWEFSGLTGRLCGTCES